ncbi:MAG: hypothetical protein HPY44_20290 [Armatimonadetes bacterium]|nr:hypothetical protein [Armatimonadota bacterium]
MPSRLMPALAGCVSTLVPTFAKDARTVHLAAILRALSVMGAVLGFARSS